MIEVFARQSKLILRTFAAQSRIYPSVLLTLSLCTPPSSVAFSSSSSSPIMPAKPHSFLQGNAPLLDLTDVCTKVSEMEQQREAGFEASRKIQAAIVRAKAAIDNGMDQDLGALEKLIVGAVGGKADRNPREANLGNKVETFVRLRAFVEFLDKGTLIPPSSLPFATDEEYLAGACMGLAEDLSRYGLGRATVRDTESVSMAKDLVLEVLDYLLEFDFRNGPLRRKYDGTKYALKALEVLLYELSITSSSDGNPKPAKLPKLDKSTLLAVDELKDLRERIHHRDNVLRENLIKRCRDGQKAAKQAIFALHRQDPKKAKTLIDQCENMIQKDLLPIVAEEPGLRYGSFANLLEEYAEAKLFYAWLYGDTTQVPEMTPATPPARLLKWMEFEAVELTPAEYIGGLCDLTGEVGRNGVHKATTRDKEGIEICLATNKSILTALQMMERRPHEIGKKMDMLTRSVEKLERILYEMSLSEAAGGRDVQTSSMDIEADAGGNDN